ncbi:hypothetical protein C7M84_018147 [Penaeus vannamei]|uniref:Uncharacterized protein n=1 Tax=Penaeus vannamei TaxID=6689 RepID=A0A423SI71_PENVA|nr:hypothetical protein C7M84_018147 [Penaeus vannamei]
MGVRWGPSRIASLLLLPPPFFVGQPTSRRPAGGGPPSARQAPAPAGRMEGPVSGRVGCGPAPPTIGRGGWVRGRGWRSGLPGGAGSAGRSRAPPLACCVAAGAAARLPLGPFPRAAAWPERAGGAAACPARPFSHGLALASPHQPWRPLGPRAAAWDSGVALPHPRRGVAPAGRARAGPGRGRGPPIPRLAAWASFPLSPSSPCASRAGGGGGGRAWPLPPRGSPCLSGSRPRKRGRLWGSPGCRGRRRGCLPWPPGPSGPCPRSCGLRARADNYRGTTFGGCGRRARRRGRSGPCAAVRGILLVGPRPPGGLWLSCPLRPLGPRAEAAAGGPLLPALHPRESEAFTGACGGSSPWAWRRRGPCLRSCWLRDRADNYRGTPMAASLPSLTVAALSLLLSPSVPCCSALFLPVLTSGGVWCLLGVWAPSCALGKLGRRSLPRISLPPEPGTAKVAGSRHDADRGPPG